MKTVIFAGENSAGWSQIAASFFNVMADPEKARAISAGTSPASLYHPRVVEVMNDITIDVAKEKTEVLAPELAKGAEWIITLAGSKVGVNIQGPKREEWPPLDSPESKKGFAEVEPIRDVIAALVSGFVEREGWSRPS
ncbi:arsenate reductase ArsC [Stigmatella sp. ncwal1]|uniref:Arsenate reductase ArsC n=1 Tax=Stigmatella ashevillensis TaxID=2995309 RepID=A0ABT5DAS2_9BACT|nr:arsenate reductase ArsC [Stigmatella ashevillena]MDC0710753.1 arsenate reductase ArsC [Stigmatella ashevillena]